MDLLKTAVQQVVVMISILPSEYPGTSQVFPPPPSDPDPRKAPHSFRLTGTPNSKSANVLIEGKVTLQELREELGTYEIGDKDGPALIPAVFNPCPEKCRNHGKTGRVDCGGGQFHRLDANTASMVMLGADLDDLAPDAFERLLDHLRGLGYTFLYWNTHGHTPKKVKARILIPFAKELPLANPRHWAKVFWPALIKHCGLDGATASADPSCRNPSRIYYTPRKPAAEGPHKAGFFEGRLLDWEPIFPDIPKIVPVSDVPPAPRQAAEDPSKPVDLEDYRKRLGCIHKSEFAPLIVKLLNGEALSPAPRNRPPGGMSRYLAWRQVTAIMAIVAHESEATDALLELIKPSHMAEAAESPDDYTKPKTILDLLLSARAQAPEWRRQEEEKRELIHEGMLKAAENHETKAQHSGNATERPWMPAPGYQVNERGIFKVVTECDSKGEDREKFQFFACAPVHITEHGADEHGRQFVTLEWSHGGGRKSRTFPRSDVNGYKLIELNAYGVPVNRKNHPWLTDYLQTQETHCYDQLKKVPIFTQCGWSDDHRSFVAGGRIIGEPDESGEVLGRVVMTVEQTYLAAFREGGDAETYKNFVCKIRDKSLIAEMAWAAGYAASLLRLLNIRSFSWSLVAESLSGKSAAQALAVSAFGRPEDIKTTADITAAAINSLLASRRDQITWLDDTQNLKREEMFEQLTYIIGAGTSAARAKQDGELRQRKNWRTLALISGERQLLSTGAAQGAANRTIETRAKPFDSEAEAREIHETLNKHFGHTGPVFIRALMKDYVKPSCLEDLRKEYKSLARELKARNPKANEELCANAAVFVFADVLARTLVFGEDRVESEERALKAGSFLLSRAQESRQEQSTPWESAYGDIVAWAVGAWSSVPQKPIHKEGELPTVIDPGMCFIEEQGRVLLLITSVALKRVAKECNFNCTYIVNELLEHQRLIPGTDRNQKQRRLKNGPPTRFYQIVMESGPEDDLKTEGAKPSNGSAVRREQSPCH